MSRVKYVATNTLPTMYFIFLCIKNCSPIIIPNLNLPKNVDFWPLLFGKGNKTLAVRVWQFRELAKVFLSYKNISFLKEMF